MLDKRACERERRVDLRELEDSRLWKGECFRDKKALGPRVVSIVVDGRNEKQRRSSLSCCLSNHVDNGHRDIPGIG